ncbi:unnamed protein product, partial [Didymodactylos carnosus]
MKIACHRYNTPYFRFYPALDETVRMNIGTESDLNQLIELTTDYMNTDSVQADINKLAELIKHRVNEQETECYLPLEVV